MLHIINSQLIQSKTEPATNDFGDHFKTHFSTTALAINPEAKETTDRYSGVRLILTMICPDKTAGYNMSIHTKESPNGKLNVLLKSLPTNKYDNDVFLMAIPFNGLIKPLPINPDFHVYHGVVINCMNGPIEVDEVKYNKIIYFIVEPVTKSLRSNVPTEHKDQIKFIVESFEGIDGTEKQSSAKGTFELTCSLQADGKLEYLTTMTSSTIDFEDMSKYRHTPIYTAFKPRKFIKKPIVETVAKPFDDRGINETYRQPLKDDGEGEYAKSKNPGKNRGKKSKHRG